MPSRSGGVPLAGCLDHPIPVLRPRDVGTVRTDAVKRAAGLNLGREVNLDPVAPVFGKPRYARRHMRFPTSAYTASHWCPSVLIEACPGPNINLSTARVHVHDTYNQVALDELNALIARYGDKPWYQMRYANTHKTTSAACEIEKPAAYNSELVGGTGWYRDILVAPEQATCLTVWMYGDSVFSPEGHSYGDSGVFPLGSAWFRGPPRPQQAQNSPGTRTGTGCFSLLPDRAALRQCLYNSWGN